MTHTLDQDLLLNWLNEGDQSIAEVDNNVDLYAFISALEKLSETEIDVLLAAIGKENIRMPTGLKSKVQSLLFKGCDVVFECIRSETSPDFSLVREVSSSVRNSEKRINKNRRYWTHSKHSKDDGKQTCTPMIELVRSMCCANIDIEQERFSHVLAAIDGELRGSLDRD
ncbi:MAG TPA: hypothetical protein VN838_05695 [Bradyrhizobium sp.]|nr:hypothetical protein [Bradyrhizobium sp.]